MPDAGRRIIDDKASSLARTSPDGVRAVRTEALWAFAELGRITLGDRSMEDVLTQVAELARTVLPGVSDVSVTLIQGGRASTAAQTGPIAVTLDRSQYDGGEGPCLDAAVHQSVNVITDMASEPRWPAFTAEAMSSGIRSSLSIGLPLHDDVTGALNIYATTPDAFDDDAVERAQAFAAYAGVTLTNASLYAAAASLAEQMTQAMASRAVIEQAKGILVAQRRVSPDEAFTILSAASQSANRKLRDIAQAMVDGTHGQGVTKPS